MNNVKFQELVNKRKNWVEATKENEFEIETILAGLYDDPSHFVYEILQNAEDAGAKTVTFHLFDDRLEIYHNGEDFDFDDVDAITSIGKTTKKEDLNLIGKFGIGFKSVFAISNSPCIHSGSFNLRIDDFVVPVSLEIRKNRVEGTKLVFPFNHKTRKREEVFNLVKRRLKDIGLHTLLFLTNIEKIEWKIGKDKPDYYIRESKKIEEQIKRVSLRSRTKWERWLVFERPVRINDKNLKVEIAFKIAIQEGNQETIIPIEGAKLAAFFETGKRTDLKFLIQGPFRTTPTRDTIPLDEETNKGLIGEIAILVAESIPKIKEQGLLNVEFLKTLPIDSKIFLEVNDAFELIYKRVKEKFKSNEELLPTYDDRYVSAQQALIGRGKDLRDLLSPEQLKMLFNRTKWLDENITVDNTPELRKYLMEEIGVREISPERFAREFKESFIEKQSDEWVKKFYGFLLKRRELWQDDGILRSKPIIRLDDGGHTRPFDSDGKPLVYLPSAYETSYPTIKKSLFDDERVKNFLLELGLKGADIIDYIESNILSKYRHEEAKINPEENINDVKQIFKLLKNLSDERKTKLLDALKDTPFLVAMDFGNFKVKYKEPADIYLGEKYTGNKELDIYFEGNENAWFLDGRYLNVIDVSILETIGCKTKIPVNCPDRKASWNETITIYDFHGSHKRGLHGFDPDCEIEGLEYALEHINPERAKIIWNILKEHHKRIYGTVESSPRKDYNPSTKEEKFSEMGKLLISYPWLPDKEGNFHKPSEILLSELHEEFDQESLEAKHIAEKLKFKTVVEDQLLEQLPIAKRRRYERVDTLYQIMPEEKVNEMLDNLIEQYQKREESHGETSVEEISKQVEGSLVTPPSKEIDNSQIRSRLTPEDEEIIRKNYGNEILNRLNKIRVIHKPKISGSTKIIDSVDPKEFLLDQYNGHCQICKTKLYLGPNKNPWVNTDHLFKKIQGKYGWTNMEFNVLGVCPNCQVLMDRGGRDIRNVIETAKKVSREEVAPEEVDEKIGNFHIGGLFYIIPIEVVGKKTEIIYSQTHMAKLAAFIEQTTEKAEVEYDTKGEEEPVLTPATAIQKGEKYEPVNDKLPPLIKRAFEMAKRDDGWAYLADLGNFLRKLDPRFNHRTYGYNKLSEMIRAYEDALGLKIRYSPPTRKIRGSNSSKRKKSVKLHMREPRVDESCPLRYE